MIENRYDLIIFSDAGVSLNVRVDPDKDTVWLTVDQMALLFVRDRSVITRHIMSIYKEGELDKMTTHAKNAQVQYEGGRAVNRILDYYNLDVIISIGYRVKSRRGVLFRRWANTVLKQYLLEGYVFNQKRLAILNRTIFIILLFWCWKSILSVAWGKPRGLSKRRQLRRFYF